MPPFGFANQKRHNAGAQRILSGSCSNFSGETLYLEPFGILSFSDGKEKHLLFELTRCIKFATVSLVCSSPLLFAQAKTEPQAASNDDKVVISIGDQKISAREVNTLLESMPPQYRPYYSGPGRRQLADFIVNNRLQAEEGEKRGLEKKQDVRMKISIAREGILTAAARAELEKEVLVTDEALQKYLDEHVVQYEEAKVKRILIRSKSSMPFDPSKPPDSFPSDDEAHAKADEIHKKLIEGGDFEELAAKFS